MLMLTILIFGKLVFSIAKTKISMVGVLLYFSTSGSGLLERIVAGYTKIFIVK